MLTPRSILRFKGESPFKTAKSKLSWRAKSARFPRNVTRSSFHYGDSLRSLFRGFAPPKLAPQVASCSDETALSDVRSSHRFALLHWDPPTRLVPRLAGTSWWRQWRGSVVPPSPRHWCGVRSGFLRSSGTPRSQAARLPFRLAGFARLLSTGLRP